MKKTVVHKTDNLSWQIFTVQLLCFLTLLML